jgi:hypothetical protein
MTVVAAHAAGIDWVDGPVAGLDPDSDVGFWSMSPASAEQVTVQIRTVLDRAWEFIALAYKGRAFIALGYPNWDAYVDARFGDLRIAVPREHRTQVVAELAGVRMSCRAIAKVLGVGVATVHRELTRTSLGDPSAIADSDGVGVVIGRDGKEYPRTRRTEPPAAPCSTCGEHHPEQTGDCPWDLFAQGLAPHPHGGPVSEASVGEETTYGMPHRPDPHPTGPNRENVDTPQVQPEIAAEPTDDVSRPKALQTLTGLVGQLEAALEEVSGLGDVIRAIEDATADLSADHWDFGIEARVRRLRDDLEREATGWPSLAVRLGLVADTIRSSS